MELRIPRLRKLILSQVQPRSALAATSPSGLPELQGEEVAHSRPKEANQRDLRPSDEPARGSLLGGQPVASAALVVG